EVLLEHLALVAEREHEIAVTVMRVVFHDVPEDRPAPDVDERLGLELGLLAHARALTAAQNDDLHLGFLSACGATPRSLNAAAPRPSKREAACAGPGLRRGALTRA